ncbi:hypothetical protein [Dyella subtropica]|uniref:hypothetical protein n=1 Tax=Dyella subtropica TaxID=2992127 RepID=UPI0022583826|nr:hypothetical protein [Dyella subtropica]
MATVSDESIFDLSGLDAQAGSEHMVALDAAQARFGRIAEILSKDKVVLIQGASPADADRLISGIAAEFGLSEELEIQAGFAAIHGHRKNVGKYFMTVNERGDYHFIPPHSEGNSGMNMQISSFYCYENTTDGGETILWGSSDDEDVWSDMKEFKYKVKTDRTELTKMEIATLKMTCEVEWPRDRVKEGDDLVHLMDTPVADVSRYGVLQPAKKNHSRILGVDRFVCWDTIGNVDRDIAKEFIKALRRVGLFKAPHDIEDGSVLDCSLHRKVWSSGIRLPSIFNRAIVRKLRAGELVVMNNMTWAHSACGWTPGTGVRRVAAAFA